MNESKDIAEFGQQHIVENGIAPHFAAGVAQQTAHGWQFSMGGDKSGSVRRPFDLASISKSVFASSVARLVSEGEFRWDTPVEALLPEVKHTWGGAQPLDAHLSHRAGMVPHIELFKPSWGGAAIVRARLLQRAANAGCQQARPQAVYSDLGYILVGAALERHYETSLDHVINKTLLKPWRLRIGSARMWAQLAAQGKPVPTEIQPPRGGLLQGRVHDDNAWSLSGTGCCGHAGLFGTVQGLLAFGCHLLDEFESPWLAPLIRRRAGGSLRMGFDGKSSDQSLAGGLASTETFGHLGFTGTSLWCDPETRRVTALLTNRVFPRRSNPRINAVRPKFHDFLWAY